MIDLRSDTLTLPCREMLEAILDSPLGDDGRADATGRGEDLTVRRLEDLAAELTGMEAACYAPTGTFGNSSLILTVCRPGDKVLVDRRLHIYKTEKMVFDPRFGQLTPVFYPHNDHFTPDCDAIRELLDQQPDIKMLCVENTHNYAGGVATPPAELAELRELTARRGVFLHMDGARLFNAAEALGVTAKELCRHVDSVMFCVSKGLGAPIGSLVCGPAALIREVRATRQILGGGMRQVGVAAAPAIYALEHNIDRLREDRENAALFAEKAITARGIRIDPATVQSNIVLMDVSGAGVTVEELLAGLAGQGLKCSRVDDTHMRVVFHLGNTADDAKAAAEILCAYMDALK